MFDIHQIIRIKLKINTFFFIYFLFFFSFFLSFFLQIFAYIFLPLIIATSNLEFSVRSSGSLLCKIEVMKVAKQHFWSQDGVEHMYYSHDM